MKRKILALMMAALFAVAFFAGCSNQGETPVASESPTATAKPTATPTPEPQYEQLDPNIEGDLTIMMWSGDGTYMEDIGHKDLAPEELGGFNQAAAYAVAKEFNKLYPNVKINIFAKTDGPDDAVGNWAQHKENFRAEYGKYPDLFAETDIPGMIQKGLIADLSLFSDDPLYKTLNTGIMDLMKFGDVQAALPQYLLPWGVYVNKSLAED
ncbi:MAG: extracellular solute-binding protein, partial [Clostridia bacterium]|nr:extracellular solute-binding protein [Clostridia bacterium]